MNELLCFFFGNGGGKLVAKISLFHLFLEPDKIVIGIIAANPKLFTVTYAIYFFLQRFLGRGIKVEASALVRTRSTHMGIRLHDSTQTLPDDKAVSET